MTQPPHHSVFSDLTPDRVLDLVEQASSCRCSNICRPLNSYINRVYEVVPEEGDPLIVKFYRPGRWSEAALRDELDFLLELADEDIPVIPPIEDADGCSLHRFEDMFFAVFPRIGGRICDEPNVEQWLELGRLLGRVHTVGARRPAGARVTWTPRDVTRSQVDFILQAGCLPADLCDAWERAVEESLALIQPLFDELDMFRIHGDAHAQNLIYRPGEHFYMIDFDDMAMGPPVQDLWMLLPGRLTDARAEAGLLLEGYETFRTFPRSTLRLIEPLRLMRFVHFTAWCVVQAADRGFSRLAPDWGSHAWWQEEIRQLRTQHREIIDALEADLPAL